MSGITTHVLDTATGRPAEGVPVILYRQARGETWEETGRASTNGEGRVREWLTGNEGAGLKGVPSPPEKGFYKLRFEVKAYFNRLSGGVRSFYPIVEIVFEVTGEAHYHVPLLLSPFGYSTYRGS